MVTVMAILLLTDLLMFSRQYVFLIQERGMLSYVSNFLHYTLQITDVFTSFPDHPKELERSHLSDVCVACREDVVLTS